MGNWNITAYSNTGMTTANTIDHPRRLANARQKILPALNIVSAQGLKSVQVKCAMSDIENVDYIAIQDSNYTYFYYVTGPAAPMANDVWVLPLVMDSLLTAEFKVNGIENLPILGGVTERHHVPKSSDTYGAYTEEDPLLVPSAPLTVFAEEMFTPSPGAGDHQLVESTLALTYMADNVDTVDYDGLQVPQVRATGNHTQVIISTVGSVGTSYITPGTEYFDAENQKVQDGIARARSLGAESAILNSWIVPDDDYSAVPTADGDILGIVGVDETHEANSIRFDNINANNKRVAYGSLNKIVMVSPACGTRMEFNPEDVAFENGVLQSKMKVRKVTDPRPNGRPYFIPVNYKESTHTFDNALPGMEWANAPLVYTGKSGSTLEEIAFRSRRQVIDAAFDIAQQRSEQALWQGVQPQLGYTPGVISPVLKPITYKSNFGGQSHDFVAGYDNTYSQKLGDIYLKGSDFTGFSGISGYLSSAGNALANFMLDSSSLQAQYMTQARAELQSLALSTCVVAPELHFPRSETIRDFIGNDVIVAQYSPRSEDIQKLDKILTMFGYKDTKALESSDFTNRSKFNFVSASGVEIGGDLPRWLREGVAAQLSAGVRVWHQLPDRTAYTDGSNT